MNIQNGEKMLARSLNAVHKIRLEYIALPLFIAVFLIFFYLKFFSYIFLVGAAVVGASIFIIFDKYSSNEQGQKPPFELSEYKLHRFRLILSILFFIFYGLSFFTLLQGFYTKTIWYYVFISVCTGSIAMEIFFIKTKNQGTINLFKSFLLVLNITLSNQILFPDGIALPDTSYHLNSIVIPIINEGYVPRVGDYEFFPISDIFVAANSLIAGSDPRMTYLYLGGFSISLGLLLVFILGNEFVNLRFGLFAALIYPSLDYLIMYGSHPVHMSFIYFLSILLLMCALYIYKKKSQMFVVIYTLVIISMIFIHHYSAMILFFILATLVIVEVLMHIKESNYQFRFLGLTQLYIVVLLTQWTYYSNLTGNFFSLIQTYQHAFEAGSKSVIQATAYDKLPIVTLFLNTSGSSILIILSVIGFFYFFKKRLFFYTAILVISIMLAILLGIGVSLSLIYLLPDRMYPFLQLFGLVFLGSAGIMWLINLKIESKKLKTFFVIILIMNLTFFSLSSTIAGFETSLFIGEKTAYTRAYNTPYDTYFSDWIGFNMPNNSKNYNSPPITESGDIDFQNIQEKSFIIFNKFWLKTGFNIETGGHTGEYIFKRLKESNLHSLYEYEHIYNNGMVDVFFSKRG